MLFEMTVTKLDVVESFDTEKLPEASFRYVFQYGLNKSINDAHASIKRSDYAEGDEGTAAWKADVSAASYARIEQIRSGNFTRVRTPDGATARIKSAAKEAGVDLAKIDPVKLVAWLKRQSEQGRAA